MSFNKKVEEYTDRWVERNIITSAQKVAILGDLKSETTTGNFFKILAVIGALFIGIGVILIISSNWYHLPKIFKLLLILFMPILSIGAGYYLSFVKSVYSKIGDAFIVLGSLLIGASIGLYGQLYNIDGSLGSLLLLWFVLSLPITIIFKYMTLATVSTVLFYGTIFVLIQDSDFWNWSEKERITVQVFHLIPFGVLLAGEFIRKSFKNNSYGNVISIVEVISLKLLLAVLFIGTLAEEEFALLGETAGSELIQNFLFLGSVFSVMWYSNKNYMTQLRHTTFFWLGAYIIAKYFAWFWSYMETGLFFLIFGILLIGMVWVYIKILKYIKDKHKLITPDETLDTYFESNDKQ